jgi:hypothetical protein
MEMTTASHLVKPKKVMVECHHKTADTAVIGLSADAATEELRLSRLQSIMVTSKRKGMHSSEAQVAALEHSIWGKLLPWKNANFRLHGFPQDLKCPKATAASEVKRVE